MLGFHLFLESLITVKSCWNTQTKKIRPLFGVLNIKQIVVLHAKVFYDWHIVQIVAKGGAHR